MKIALNMPEETRLIFVNYAFVEGSDILMGCKQIDTEHLKDGAEYDLRHRQIWNNQTEKGASDDI